MDISIYTKRKMKFRVWGKKNKIMVYPNDQGLFVFKIYNREVRKSMDLQTILLGRHKDLVPLEFINRQDKNGYDIYEADILKVRVRTEGRGSKTRFKDFFMPVVWNFFEAGFTVEYPDHYGNYRFMDGNWASHEKVGNIFVSTELIKLTMKPAAKEIANKSR